MMTRTRATLALGYLAATLGACKDDGAAGSGTLQVLLDSEATIADGLAPGQGLEQVQDGWAVRFDRYVAVLGDVEVHLTANADESGDDPALFAVDLAQVPSAGLALWRIDGLTPGAYEFGYAAGAADVDTQRHESVDEDTFARLREQGWTYLIEGRIEQPGGASCPPADQVMGDGRAPNGRKNARGEDCYDNPAVRFSFGAAVPTRYGPCEIDGVPGVQISDGATTTVAASIHGDHIFFNGFPEGDEGSVTRLAQWLADSDLNLDGQVTRAELEQLAPADLAELDPSRYPLGGAPLTLTTMWDYVRGQLKTQGHFQGEGECPLDGTDAHDH